MDNTVIGSNAMELKYDVNKKPVLIIYTGKFIRSNKSWPGNDKQQNQHPGLVEKQVLYKNHWGLNHNTILV